MFKKKIINLAQIFLLVCALFFVFSNTSNAVLLESDLNQNSIPDNTETEVIMTTS